MKEFKVNISNFKVGEVSKYVNKFNAKNFYYNCSLVLKNLMVSPWGGLIRRHGSKFIGRSANSEKEVRIIAFEHNNNSILMELYPSGIYFYLNGEPIIKDGKHYRIDNFWISEDQIAKLNYVYDDKAQCYYFFSLDRTPSILKFNDSYEFTLANVEYIDGPYLDMNKTATTLTLSGTTGTVEITASADLFQSDDALMNQGRFIRIAHKGIWGVARIDQFIDAKKIKVIVSVPFNGTEATKDFKIGAWGGNNYGFPSMATIFNGRMYYGVTKKDKKTIWVSKTGEYTNMSPTTRVNENNVVSDIVAADNSITLSIPNGKSILWLESNKDNVLVGSQEGTFTLLPFSVEEPISPFNYTVAQLSSQKNSHISVSTDFLTFYADWSRENIFAIEVSQDKMVSLSQINSWCLHLFSHKIKDMIYLDYPSKVLCVLMENGSLAMCHIVPEDGYISYSWSSHQLGGENTRVVSMSTSYDENQQYLWLATKRKEKSYEEVKLIEVVNFDSLKNMYLDNQQTPIYLDLHLSKNMVSNQITELDVFKGENVSVINKNNDFLGTFTVNADGVLTIEGNIYEDQEVTVGLCFDSIYQSMYLENLNENISESKINKASLLCYKSSHVDIFSDLDEKNIQQNVLSNANFSKTGYQNIDVNLHSNWQKDSSITIKQNLPFSMNIMSLDLTVTSK